MYYDGGKLLSMKDRCGQIPEIFLCESNRNAGKTTFFTRLLIKRFLKNGCKFVKLVRYRTNLVDSPDKLFGDVIPNFFRGHSYDGETAPDKLYTKLYLDNKHCGFVIPINAARAVKECWQIFSGTTAMFLDEYQSEDNVYVPNEVQKLFSIHTSLARGEKKQVRYLPLYACSNSITMLNPYYHALGIQNLPSETKFYRGDGFVLEHNFNEGAAAANASSGFSRAFKNLSYANHVKENIYLNDSVTFIEKPRGNGRYVCTFLCGGNNYAIYMYDENGYAYTCHNVDYSFPRRVSVYTSDMRPNYVMMHSEKNLIQLLRYFFQVGCFRFKDISCKNATMELLSYR